MNPRNWLLIKGLTLILLLWVGVGGIIKLAGSIKASPAKIAKYVQTNNLAEVEEPEARKKIIGKVAKMMNELEPEDLEKLDTETGREAQREMFRTMSADEQWYFMEQRMGRAFSQMMGVFNNMERSERKEMVEKALKQIRKGEGQGPEGRPDMEEADPEMVEKMAEAGMEAYFRDASAETKLDLAPLMEELQDIMSSPGRRPGRPGK